ncbi:MAG: hypothetical protein D6B27_10925 [Gammaproteobacteria bacterium]|nr:MAG: hypothetical protein D6B27_10925 [Gammaproteobacteria bacterium]
MIRKSPLQQLLVLLLSVSLIPAIASAAELGEKSIRSYDFSSSFIRHADGNGMLTSISTVLDQQDATFNIVAGLADTDGISLEASNYPGCYLRHSNYQIYLNCYEDSDLFRNDATFYIREGLADSEYISLESANFPGHFIRHEVGFLFISQNDGSDQFAKNATFEIRAPLTEGDIDGMNFYFGNIHGHTKYSDGKETPARGYEWARYEAGFAFYAVTDHAILVNKKEWHKTAEQADANNAPGYFVAIRGFEWSHPLYGHINVFNTSSYTNFISKLYLPWFYDWLDDHRGLAQFNHPGREDWEFDDFKYQSDVADDNFFAIETGNKDTGNNDFEFLPYYQKVLDKGWKLAPTNNQDNHSLSTNSHRTVMIMPALTREDIYNTMKAKRIYSTDDPNMKVVFKYGNAWMGETVDFAGEPIELKIEIFDDEPIKRVQIVSSNGAVVKDLNLEGEGKTSVVWNPILMPENISYYYVRIYEENIFDDDLDTQIAVTAPIWIKQ